MMARSKATICILCTLLLGGGSLFYFGQIHRQAHKKSASLPFKQSRIVDIDFDDGLGKGHRIFNELETSPADQTRYIMLKKTWQKCRPSFVQPQAEPKIPKVIHQIWLGPKRPPSFFHKFSAVWKEQHPDWEYRLWTDADVKSFDFELRDLFDQSSNYGEKSDILRCEILLKYGGLYVDTDFECLKPFDEFVTRYDFFAGVEPPHAIPESDRLMLVTNALVGSTAGHPILKRWKEYIRARWQRAEDECVSPIEKVLVRTFLSFGDAVENHLETSKGADTTVIFPATYFYPFKQSFFKRPANSPSLFKQLLFAFDVKKDRPFSSINPETYAVHHFAATWQKSASELFKDVFREIIQLRKEQRYLNSQVQELQRALEASDSP